MPSEPPELKELALQPADVDVLMKVRAQYVIQLLITLASSLAQNLAGMFTAFKETPSLLQQLSDLDSCLLSLEFMCSGWTEALTAIGARGSFDPKTVLLQVGAAPTNKYSRSLLGSSVGDINRASGGQRRWLRRCWRRHFLNERLAHFLDIPRMSHRLIPCFTCSCRCKPRS